MPFAGPEFPGLTPVSLPAETAEPESGATAQCPPPVISVPCAAAYSGDSRFQPANPESFTAAIPVPQSTTSTGPLPAVAERFLAASADKRN